MKRSDVQGLLVQTLQGLPKSECRSCECFLGFVTQLGIDASEDLSDILAPLKSPKEEIHGCLGCDPCPPAEEFAAYLQRQRNTGG